MANNINRVEVLGMANHRWSNLCGLHGVSTQPGGHDHATLEIKENEDMNKWITTHWFPLLICAALAVTGEWALAIILFLVWELYESKKDKQL